MSSSPVSGSQTQQPGKRGSRGRGGRKGPKASQSRQDKPVATSNATMAETTSSKSTEATKHMHEASDVAVSEATICFICAEPVKYYSVSACNHRTCHICALRLRALYKKFDCTFCKEAQVTVIFTSSPFAQFSSYTPNDIPHKDSKLSIYFETVDMMEETLVLLRYNCPDRECDYTATGWEDLKLHVRATHDKMLCDLCLRFKKVFTHEHTLYPPNILPFHLPSKLHRAHKQPPKEPIEGGVHPLCEFCRECFFSDDELYVHMRERHEECFICKRNEIRDQYFRNYESLEKHFAQDHFVCPSPMCQAQKFVVFGSAIDLKAHQVEVHGAEMSSRDRRDVRRVQADFAFEDIRGERGSRANRERDREPPESNRPPPRASGSRREAFGGRLTGGGEAESAGGAPSVSNVPGPSVPGPSTAREDTTSGVSEQYTSFLKRIQAIAPNPGSAIPAVKAALRGFRMNESSARDLISTIWNILSNDLDDTASIINIIVDLLDEEGKKSDLLASWNGFKIEQRRQYPELVVASAGTAYAGVASGRVISAKKATTRSSRQSSRQVLDRVAQAASASSPRVTSPTPSRTTERFPTLPGPSTARSISPQPHPQRGPAPASAPTYFSLESSSATQGASVKPRKSPPSLSLGAFPELPSSTNTRTKPAVVGNQSLRNIIGDPLPSSSAWRATTRDSMPSDNGNNVAGAAPRSAFGSENDSGGWKGKKGKGKQKQMLFTLGSFPT
ncbi:hypothetical protein EDD16DRAFT_1663186 [Pisolithus croceorrhizus]|nr:hypothetical protein EDD16DRAFT_1663186 [Pisolithus croceorrhizus]KAI6115389.1 hypothetical protein EV401DRAFT_1865175 [Pisolithus croceorrhizus]KAI6164065.1 hypothetical protein EDD17DRAFT_1565381 [Pisolithus thermaeus]